MQNKNPLQIKWPGSAVLWTSWEGTVTGGANERCLAERGLLVYKVDYQSFQAWPSVAFVLKPR